MARFLHASFRCSTSRAPLCVASPPRKEAAVLLLVQLRAAPVVHFGYAPTSVLSPYSRAIHGFGAVFHLFDEMRERELISRTAEISSLTRRNRGDRALLLFKSMFAEGMRPNYVTVLCIVRAVGAVGLEELIGGIHALVIKFGFAADMSVLTVLVGIYSSLQDVESVLQLFHQNKSRDLVLWTAVVSALSKNRRFLEAVDAFRGMLHDSITPNYVSVMSVLSACAGLGTLSHVRELHGYAVKNFHSEMNLQNVLVDVYARCNKLDVAISIFYRIKAKDAISWNTIICRCSEFGQPREALLLFLRMRHCQAKPEENVIRVVLTACLQSEELGFALGMHCYVIKINLSSSISVGTALLRTYADFGKVEIARALFDDLHHKDLIAWSAMVSVYAKAGCPYLALETFKHMQLTNERPNEITLVSLLEACFLVGVQQHGQSIHAHVLRTGFSFNEYVASALIDFYCKIGRLRQGKALFTALENRDLVCWSSMINGYGINGCGKEAVGTFHEMLKHGLKPNGIVFISLLSACSHCGLVDEGWRWFYHMEDKYGVCPTIAHYSCVVDMLSRQGRVKEALEFIDKMPLKPDVGIWGTLFSGCKVAAGDIEVAEIAAGWLVKLDPGNSSYHVALSNLYAELGWWSDVERIRKSLEEKGFRKILGYSLL